MPRKKGIPKQNPFAIQQYNELTRDLTNVNEQQLSDVESDSSYDKIFNNLEPQEKQHLNNIVSDDETNEWDDKLLLPDNERSKVFSKETGDFIREELKKTQAVIAKQKKIENALKKIRIGTTSSPPSLLNISEPRVKRTRRSTARFEPEPDSILVKRAMRESMPRKEYDIIPSSSTTRIKSHSKTICDSSDGAKLTKKLCGPKSWKRRMAEEQKKRMAEEKNKKTRKKQEVSVRRKKYEEHNKQGVEANYSTSTGTIRDGKYYCILCNAGGWAGPSGLWYHMKRVHNAESRNYNKRNLKNRKTRKRRHTERHINRKEDDANLLLGFAEAANEEQSTKKVITKNAIINQLQSLFKKLNNPDGASIFIELINSNSRFSEIIINETKNYIEKISVRDKSKIKRITLDFLQTLALIKKNYSLEQLEGFVIEELSEDGTGVMDEDNKEINIVASSNPFKKGGRRKTRRKSKDRKRRKTKRKKKRSKRKTKRRR